jgi:hypothetical protein
MSKLIDLTGEKFSKLTVLGFSKKDSAGINDYTWQVKN